MRSELAGVVSKGRGGFESDACQQGAGVYEQRPADASIAVHCTLTQGLLDVKRLHWNTRVFRGGKRKGRCPYEHLGLMQSSYNFWSLLQVGLTTAIASEKANAKAKNYHHRHSTKEVSSYELVIWDDPSDCPADTPNPRVHPVAAVDMLAPPIAGIVPNRRTPT